MHSLNEPEFQATEPAPIDLIARFGTCSNYPRNDPYVVQLLTISLASAARQFDVKPSAIVQRCVEVSSFCPTEHDFLSIAHDLREDRRRKEEPDITAQWKAKYGSPQPFDWMKIDTDHVKRVRDRESALLSAIKAKYPGELSWAAMAAAARELGYEDYAKAWEKAMV